MANTMDGVPPALLTFLLSLAPGFEGRYATALALSLGLSPCESLLIPALGEVILAISLSFLASVIDAIAVKLCKRNNFIGRISRTVYSRILRARSKAENLVRKWGIVGLATFVAIPLPVTGVWTGALVGYLLGMKRRDMALALALGGIASVLIVGIPSILISKLGVGKP